MHKELFITSSLPRIYWEDITTEDLAYKNQLCLIKSNLLNLNKIDCTTLIPNS